MERTLLFSIILVSCFLSLITALPLKDDNANEDTMPLFSNQNVDYNTMMNNVKDFFMYLPIMFSTLRETMSGFPKLAEGIRILTSPNYERFADDDNDCKCRSKSMQNSNEIDKSSRLL